MSEKIMIRPPVEIEADGDKCGEGCEHYCKFQSCTVGVHNPEECRLFKFANVYGRLRCQACLAAERDAGMSHNAEYYDSGVADGKAESNALIDTLVELVMDYDKMLISNQDVLGDYYGLILRTDQALANAKEMMG